MWEIVSGLTEIKLANDRFCMDAIDGQYIFFESLLARMQEYLTVR